MASFIALAEDSLKLPVTLIRVTVHTAGMLFDSDIQCSNHASISLIVGPSASIRLNMTKAGPTDTVGRYTETFCRYIVSTSSLHNIDLIPAKGVTVSHLVDYIHSMGMEQYRMTSNGDGCRFWVKSIILGFEFAGYIDPSSPIQADGVAQDLQYIYSPYQEPELEEIVPGTFV